MRKFILTRSILPIAIIIALIAACGVPHVVLAEGEAPEEAPPSDATTPTSPIDTTGIVQSLSDNNANVIDGGQGMIPLASQTTIDALYAPDPWFFGACAGGKCTGYELITDALADWHDKKGTGMIYLEGGFNRTDYVEIYGTDAGFATFKGIARDPTLAGSTPIINGWIYIEDLPAGLTLQGFSVFANDAGPAVSLYDNIGALKLTDISVSNEAGGGIDIENIGPIEFLRVDASNNYSWGAYLYNCGYSVDGCPATGAVKVTNSSFNYNGHTGDDYEGIWIESASPITINGISAIGTYGDGLDIESYGSATVKNAVLNSNISGTVEVDDWGSGLWFSEYTTGNIILENIVASGNGYDGFTLTTTGNITITKVEASDNGNMGLYIGPQYGVGTTAGKTITMTNGIFRGNTNENVTITASGAVTLTNIDASNSTNSYGIFIDNTQSPTPLPVTLNVVKTWENGDQGIQVNSKGNITLNAVSVWDNASEGVVLENITSGATGSILMLSTLGANSIGDNGLDGLQISTLKNITLNTLAISGSGGNGITVAVTGLNTSLILNNVSSYTNDGWGIAADVGGAIIWNKGGAWQNGQNAGLTGGGAQLGNTFSGLPKAITLKDVYFDENLGNHGLLITSLGTVTLTNISASSNAFAGLWFDNMAGFGGNVIIQRTLTEGYNKFNLNGTIGLYIITKGSITLNRVQADENGSGNARLDTCQSTGDCQGRGSITINGTSIYPSEFSSSKQNQGLWISSYGAVKMTNIFANYNDGAGIEIVYSGGPVSVMGTTNMFSYNGANASGGGIGLIIRTPASVSLTNVIAYQNDGAGFDIETQSSAGNVTIKATVANFLNPIYANNGTGIIIHAGGSVVIGKVDVSMNSKGGLYIYNETALLPKPVTITSSRFIQNTGTYDGVYVDSIGPITITSVVSGENGKYGGSFDNAFASTTPAPVTITKSTFEGNASLGIKVKSKAMIAVSGITVWGNQAGGALFINSTSPTSAAVNMLGTNVFVDNASEGLRIESNGLVTVAGTTASHNGLQGILILTNGAITITGSQTNLNAREGVLINTAGNVILSSLIALSNGYSANLAGVNIVSTAGKVTILNSSMIGNTAQGILVDVTDPNTQFILTNTNYFGNDIDQSGDENKYVH